MKAQVQPLSYLAVLLIAISSCNKDPVLGVNPIPQPVIRSCDNRPVINARLVPVSSLSVGRSDLIVGAAGSKILFAAGYANGNGNDTIVNVRSTRVDIHDINTNSWSTAELHTYGPRWDITVASVGNKILFAGGRSLLDGTASSMVDIYDASTNTWSTAELSKARTGIAAATLGNKVFFAGGAPAANSKVVDIYDNAANTWSTASLIEGRSAISATTAGNKIYFAGGTVDFDSTSYVSGTIDVFDGATNSWSIFSLREPKTGMACIALGNKIFWTGGSKSFSTPTLSNQAEIRNVSTGISSFACMIPRSSLQAVIKDDNIVFFTGYGPEPNGTHFEIYNSTTNTWSIGVLNQKIIGAAIIAVNNTIYVAGGSSNSFPPYYDQVWKLEF